MSVGCCYACGLLAEDRRHGICSQCLLGWVKGRKRRCCPYGESPADGTGCAPLPGGKWEAFRVWRTDAQAAHVAYGVGNVAPRYDTPRCVIT